MSILCYHSVTNGWDDPVSMEADDFARQCAILQRATTVVPLAGVLDRLAAGGGVPAGITVLTFDDGFADYVEHAVPIMERHGLTATMYVVAGSLRPGGIAVDWIRGLDAAAAPPLMTPDQIRELHDRGWDIGSHTMRHADMPTLSEAECLADFTESKQLLEDLLQAPVTTLAYPFGHHDRHVRRAAEQAGYRLAVALPEGPEKAGPYAVPRTGIYRGNPAWKFRVKTSGWYARARTSSMYQRVAGAAART
ncbi:MAG: polysaccharide deacetylase family protein [Pseudonocardia sp.]|nr:polysaccharide deacetylase family protein [Pseudonocardia sp.]